MGSNRIFNRYPFLFFVVAALVIANNLFKFAPAQVLRGTLGIVVPIILIIFGTLGYIAKAREKKDTA